MRLFVALDIPEDVRRAIASLVAKLREVQNDARWVSIESAHVTLKFIGEVPRAKAEEINTVLASVPFPTPIELSFRGLGFFPNAARPRVLWAGVEAGAELNELAAALESALEPLGIAREEREFSPHLTLARFESRRDPAELRAAMDSAGPLEFGRDLASEFRLYQSILKPAGAEYTRLATFRSQGSGPR